MKNLINYFRKIFMLEYPIDSREYRAKMHTFFILRDWKYEDTITRIDVSKIGMSVYIVIETHRPGMLIGKGGSFINALTKFLKDELKEDITIDIKECKMWHKLYR